MTRVITAVIRRGTAAWRGRCRCWYDDGGPYGLDARWVTRGCPRHGPGARIAPDWPAVAALGCICRWLGVRAGWKLTERNPRCVAEHGSYAP
jgi:hypothetical protein